MNLIRKIIVAALGSLYHLGAAFLEEGKRLDSVQQGEYKAGATLELNCTKSSEKLTITWEVPGELIICTQIKKLGAGCQDPDFIPEHYKGRLTPDRFASLKILNLNGGDTNIYTTKVTAPPGDNDSCVFSVNVIVSAPDLPSIPEPSAVIESRPASLQCQPAGTSNGTLRYTWWKDGQVYGQERDTDMLTISSTNRTDAGSYKCSVRNVVGSSPQSQPVTLVVHYPPDAGPVIEPTPGPSSVIRYQGDDANWLCRVQGGNPAATLKWPCVNLTSTPEGSGTNVIQRLTGKYSRQQNGETCTCIAEHAAWLGGTLGKRKAAITFNIYYPPGTPSVTLNKQHLLENQTYTVTCDVSVVGNPQATYRWTLPRHQLGNQPTHQLTVTRADNNQNLTCQLSNAFTENKTVDVKNSIKLNVQFSPRINLQDTYTKKENDSVDLVCSAQSNPPATDDHYRWTRGQTPVSPPCRSTCTIRDLTKDDADQYTCTVSVTPQGDYPILAASSTTTLIVQYLSPPIVPNKETTEGDSITLTCRASGVPANYTYSKWTHTGPYVEGTRTIGKPGAGEETRLIISKATYTDTGDYTCYSSNLVDSKQASGRLTVRFAPRSNSHTDGIRVVYSELHNTSILNLFVFAHPTPVSFSWFMEVNATVVEVQHTEGKYEINSGDESSRLTVINITRKEFTNYTVNATNNVLNGSLFEFRISPRGCPEVPMLDEVTVTAVSIRIRWRPRFDGGYRQNIRVRVCNETSTSCADTVIEDPRYNEEQVTVIESPRVASGTCYSVTVQAENAHNGGCVRPVPDRQICTKVRPVVKEGKFTVERKGNIALLRWSAPSEDQSYDKQMVEQWETGPRTKRSNPECTQVAKCNQTEVTKGTHSFIAGISTDLEYRFTLVLYDGETPVFSLTAKDVKPPGPGSEGQGPSKGLIVGAVLGGILAAVLITLLVLLFIRRKSVLKGGIPGIHKRASYSQMPSGGEQSDAKNTESSSNGAYAEVDKRPEVAAATAAHEGNEGSQLYAAVNKKTKKGAVAEAPPVYAEVTKKDKSNAGAEYAEVKKAKKTPQQDVYAEVKKGKKKEKNKKDNKGKKKEKKNTDVSDAIEYANIPNKAKGAKKQGEACEYEDMGNTYQNVQKGASAIIPEDEVAYSEVSARTEPMGEITAPPPGSDGLTYMELEIVRKPRDSAPKPVIAPKPDATVYADIDLTRKVKPLPKDGKNK